MALNRRNFRFQRNLPKIGIILVIFIIALSYGLYFLFQDTAENDIKERLFEQERQQLLDANKAISQNIISDLDSILTKLKVIAVSPYIQEGEDTQTWDKSEPLVQEMYDETKELVGKTDGMFLIDKSGIIRVNALTEEEQKRQNTFVGTNISHRDYVNQAKTTHEPVFSTGLFSLDGVYRMFIVYPILNGETNEYMGLVSASIPTVDFFSRFGSIYDVQSQYLIALDRNGNYLTHGNRELVGKNFFEETTQNSSSSAAFNGLIDKVLSSLPESGYTVYNSAEGERLATAYPVSVYAERPPSYAVLVTTTTSQIYSQIENILLGQRIETFALLGIITVAVILFTVFLFKWNSSLKVEVQRRTMELNESNRYLSEANERLKVNDKMQKEFINIAAHELRTPIMPIMGVTDLIKERFEEVDQERSSKNNINNNYDNHELTITKEELGMIVRNCERLQHLAEDVLTTARIESKSLRLQKERFNLNQAVQEVLTDLEINVQDSYNIGRNNLQLLYEPDGRTGGANNDNNKYDDNSDNNIVVNADKHMIIQVISNLVNNAINFTRSGTISVEVERTMVSNHIINNNNDYNNDNARIYYNKPEAVVKIKDTGSGIDAEILPRLFTKFATKSDHKGTGLGLFISKSIVEAHGGRIWAENNTDGRGATFAFRIPIDNQNNE